MRDYSSVLAKLERVQRGKSGDTWYARCPVHEDCSPSLFLWIGKRGDLCVRCKACHGCTWKVIAKALGTEPGDWFAEPRERRRQKVFQAKIKESYDYRDETGKVLFQTVRYEPGFDGERKTFRQRRPDGKGGWVNGLYGSDGQLAVELVPYNLPDVLGRPEQPVLIVEGEKDVETLRGYGLIATTNPMGAGKWSLDYGRYLRNRRVAILPDNDDSGQAHAVQVAASLLCWNAASLRVVNLPGLPPHGDVTDWLEEGLPAATKEQKRRSLLEWIRAAPEWVRIDRQTAPLAREEQRRAV